MAVFEDAEDGECWDGERRSGRSAWFIDPYYRIDEEYETREARPEWNSRMNEVGEVLIVPLQSSRRKARK